MSTVAKLVMYCILGTINVVQKNYAVKLGHCQDEHFRPSVLYYLDDVVKTWMAYDNHLEEDMKEGPLFLTPIDGYQSNIWYKRGSRVGQQTMSQMLKNIAEEARIEGKVTKKTGKEQQLLACHWLTFLEK